MSVLLPLGQAKWDIFISSAALGVQQLVARHFFTRVTIRLNLSLIYLVIMLTSHYNYDSSLSLSSVFVVELVNNDRY